MNNLLLSNNKISSLLKEEHNQVVYKAWLNFTETAELIDENIIITVPNQYIKETIEERYFFDIEVLYRNELDFYKLVIKTEAEQIADTFKEADSIEYVDNSSLNTVEKIMLSSKQFTVSL